VNESRDYLFLDTMNEVLTMTLEFVEEARQSKDDVRLGAYLKMEQGEQNGSKVQSDADSDGGRLHGDDPSSWVS
jgi:hypothetical protein